MQEIVFSPEGMERLAVVATEAHQNGVSLHEDIEEVKLRLSELCGYTFGEQVSLSQDINKLSQLIELIYSILGVHIRDSSGELRDTEDVSHELSTLNPKIILSFKELMQF